MTELKKVTDETDASYKNFLSNSGKSAQQIGTTIDDYIQSTADFARLGYNFEESQGLAKVANIYNVVGDDLEGIGEATSDLISILKAFDLQADDSISVVDKLNEVANNYAISSGGLGQALKNSASAMGDAGNSLDQTIAMITAAIVYYGWMYSNVLWNTFNCWEILRVLHHNKEETTL
jgi:TP901 family phage tail tape measure protein